jgi:hypothetical protein
MERPDFETAPLEDLAAYIGSPELIRRYEAVRSDVPDTEGLFALPMFFLGSIARARGLHEGLAQAIASTNPHAAAPLLRQFVETLAAVLYVTRHARYAGAFIHDARVQQQRGGPSRRSPKKLVDWMEASRNSVGFVQMYDDLSEATHYGSTAWSFPFRTDENDDGIVHWQAEPRWKDEGSARVICRWTISASDAMEAWLRQLGELWQRVVASRESMSGYCPVHGPIPDNDQETCPLPDTRIVGDSIEGFTCGRKLTEKPTT